MDALIAHLWYEFVVARHCPETIHFTTRIFRDWLREPKLMMIVLKATATSLWVPYWLCQTSHYFQREGWT
jgi:hypothetical protein